MESECSQDESVSIELLDDSIILVSDDDDDKSDCVGAAYGENLKKTNTIFAIRHIDQPMLSFIDFPKK